MSSELLDLEPDCNGSDLCLTMNASAHAFLTVLGEQYVLRPDEGGIHAAERIATALQEWVRFVRRSRLGLQ